MRNESINLEFYLEKIHYKENKKLNNQLEKISESLLTRE